MALIPQRKTTLQMLAAQSHVLDLRPYIGGSQIGHSCERYLWYYFRWCFKDEISGRIQRLFNRGHREEPALIEALESVGVRCYADQEEVTYCHGHGKGHIDGRCIGVIEAPKTEHLAEFKTMSDKYFKEVCKVGVHQSKPVYYGQAQIYMRLTGLTRCLFVAVNKNDDSIYIERLRIDREYADKLIQKAEDIVLSEEPPKKRFKPTWWECRFCSANSICHGMEHVQENCRTCERIDILNHGKWQCNKYMLELTTSQQRKGCSRYEKLECLKV